MKRIFITDPSVYECLSKTLSLVKELTEIIEINENEEGCDRAWQAIESILVAQPVHLRRCLLLEQQGIATLAIEIITSGRYKQSLLRTRSMLRCLGFGFPVSPKYSVLDAGTCIRNLIPSVATGMTHKGMISGLLDEMSAAQCASIMWQRLIADEASMSLEDGIAIKLKEALTRRSSVALGQLSDLLLRMYVLCKIVDCRDSDKSGSPRSPSGTHSAAAECYIQRTNESNNRAKDSTSCGDVEADHSRSLSKLSDNKGDALLRGLSTIALLQHTLLLLAEQIVATAAAANASIEARNSNQADILPNQREELARQLGQLASACFYVERVAELAESLGTEMTFAELACRVGDVASITHLLTAYPSLTRCSNHEQQTLLHRCCAMQARTESFLAKTALSNKSSRSDATELHYSDTPSSMAVACPDPNEAPRTSQLKENALHALETMLRFPFYVDAVDASGKTPLFYCTSDRAVSLLCARGADANAFDERGVTPIHQYVLSENVDCVRTILRCGADPSIAEPMKRRNCIHFAAALANYRLLDVLLTKAEFAIDLDACDAGGNTALHLAAACQLPGSDPLKVLLLLLDRRASPYVRNNQGTTVLHLVCANPLLSPVLEVLVELLLQKGADPNAQDSEGCTPLIVACAYREFDVCRALLARGGDLNIPCKMQSTFLSLGFVDGDCDSSSAEHSQDDTSESQEVHARHAITASDLLPKKPRYGVFSSIRCAQSKIRSVNRDRCMNCGDGFAGEGPKANLLDALQLTTGRHHCRHCRRVVCPQCATLCLSGDLVPEFVRASYPDETSYRVCDVCYDVLVDRQESGWELPADWAEGCSASEEEADDGTAACDEAGVSDDPTFVERWKTRLLPKWSRSDSFGTVHTSSPAYKDEPSSSIFSFPRFGFNFT